MTQTLPVTIELVIDITPDIHNGTRSHVGYVMGSTLESVWTRHQ